MNFKATRQTFSFGESEEIGLTISVDGLRVVAKGPADVLLKWEAAMEFIEWVHDRLPHPED